MLERTYSVTLTVTVHDRAALYQAARKVARRDMSDEDYRKIRRNYGDTIEADLIMILDPGDSPMGTVIDDTAASLTWCGPSSF